MGSKLLSTDMMVSQLVMPMTNSYAHSDYAKAAIQLYSLFAFLAGFGQKISEFPKPPKPVLSFQKDIRQRSRMGTEYIRSCKDYYETNYPVVMFKLGEYQDRILKAIESQNYGRGMQSFSQQEDEEL
jgi:hypothetical protein